MSDVGIYFKFIDTNQYITGSSATDTYYAPKDQSIEQLKIDVASFYPGSRVTKDWSLKLGPPSNMTLDNFQNVGSYPINDGDILLFRECCLVHVDSSVF